MSTFIYNFFLKSIFLSSMSLILQNLKGKSVLDEHLFENEPFDEPKKMPPSKMFYLFGQKRKIVIKIEFTPLSAHSPDCTFFPLKKGFKKCIKRRRRNFNSSYLYCVTSRSSTISLGSGGSRHSIPTGSTNSTLRMVRL